MLPGQQSPARLHLRAERVNDLCAGADGRCVTGVHVVHLNGGTPPAHLLMRQRALRAASVEDWIAGVRSLPRQTRDPLDTSALMDAVRDEFGT